MRFLKLLYNLFFVWFMQNTHSEILKSLVEASGSAAISVGSLYVHSTSSSDIGKKVSMLTAVLSPVITCSASRLFVRTEKSDKFKNRFILSGCSSFLHYLIVFSDASFEKGFKILDIIKVGSIEAFSVFSYFLHNNKKILSKESKNTESKGQKVKEKEDPIKEIESSKKEELNANINMLNSQIQNQDKEIQEKNEKIIKGENAIFELENQNKGLKEKIDELKTKIEDAQKSSNALIEELKKQIKKLQEEKSNINNNEGKEQENNDYITLLNMFIYFSNFHNNYDLDARLKSVHYNIDKWEKLKKREISDTSNIFDEQLIDEDIDKFSADHLHDNEFERIIALFSFYQEKKNEKLQEIEYDEGNFDE